MATKKPKVSPEALAKVPLSFKLVRQNAEECSITGELASIVEAETGETMMAHFDPDADVAPYLVIGCQERQIPVWRRAAGKVIDEKIPSDGSDGADEVPSREGVEAALKRTGSDGVYLSLSGASDELYLSIAEIVGKTPSDDVVDRVLAIWQRQYDEEHDGLTPAIKNSRLKATVELLCDAIEAHFAEKPKKKKKAKKKAA